MKKLLIVLAVAVVVIGLAYAQTRPEKPSAVAPRYQLVAATATYEGKDGHQAEGPEVFLVDTENGRVWMYEFARVERKAPDGTVTQHAFPAYFAEVAVGFGSPLMERQLRLQDSLDRLKQNQKQP